MVVLAVTWMAKAGHDADVAPIFAKLTEESRKEPGCLMYQVHRHKTEPRRFQGCGPRRGSPVRSARVVWARATPARVFPRRWRIGRSTTRRRVGHLTLSIINSPPDA